MYKVFSAKRIVDFIEKRNFENFYFNNGYAYILSREADEIFIEAHNNTIMNETAKLVIDVLNNLDECINKAHSWLNHLNLDDKMFPHALDKGFEVCGRYFGKYSYSHDPSPTNGFLISFSTIEFYPCKFSVKFHSNNMHPFAVEEWVQ